MELNDESTWPNDVIEYLERHKDLFWAWEQPKEDHTRHVNFAKARIAASNYDRAVERLRSVLNPYTLHGYHCTRLTEDEIAQILAHGMQLPDRNVLCGRIECLRNTGLIDKTLAERLKAENQAQESNRAKMIWFCFFPPYVAGQGGIERFFRSWGGEALYNHHEDDEVTGPALWTIGTPCLIEADVPISILPPYTYLEVHLYRQFLVNRGFKTGEPVEHEDRAIEPIPAQNIRRIIRFPEADFLALTRCTEWSPPLR
jgi:hypothetical protein